MSNKENINNNEEKRQYQDERLEDVTFENQKDTDEKPENDTPKTSAKSKKSAKSKMQKEIDALKEKNNDLNDKYLRLYSEFDNFRKRTAKERLEMQKTASKDLIVDLLPILDDFERAIQSFEEHHLSEEAKKGIELIYNKLLTTMKQKGLEPMEVIGKEFDTDFHEAITEVPVQDNDQKVKVIDVVQKGYLLGDKVLRYAKVVVGK